MTEREEARIREIVWHVGPNGWYSLPCEMSTPKRDIKFLIGIIRKLRKEVKELNIVNSKNEDWFIKKLDKHVHGRGN